MGQGHDGSARLQTMRGHNFRVDVKLPSHIKKHWENSEIMEIHNFSLGFNENQKGFKGSEKPKWGKPARAAWGAVRLLGSHPSDSASPGTVQDVVAF